MTTYTLGDRTYRSTAHPWGAVHKAVRMKLADASRDEITEATGIPYGTLSVLVRHLGLQRSQTQTNQARWKNETGVDYAAIEAEMVRLYCDERVDGTEVARLMGVTRQAVYGAVRRAGRRVRSKGEAKRLQNRQRRQRATP